MPHNNSPMQDKELLQDLLAIQKFLTGNYNSYAGECTDDGLRDDFLSILKEEHDIESDIFRSLSQRGWYSVKPANPGDMQTAKQKYIGSE